MDPAVAAGAGDKAEDLLRTEHVHCTLFGGWIVKPESRERSLAARLQRVQSMTGDLAKAHDSASPSTTALADHIIKEIEAVRRALAAQTGTS